jgi:hypothetical protein
LAGLSGDSVHRHEVLGLQLEDQKKVLYAGGLQLTQQQEADVLSFCDGLPLALTVVRSALDRAINQQHVLEAIRNNLTSMTSVGVEKSDRLLNRLQFSINLLDPELRSTWLDIAVLCHDDSWHDLEMVFGHRIMSESESRNLIRRVQQLQIHVPWYPDGVSVDVVEVHHVLLTLAHAMCTGSELRIGAFNAQEAAKLLASGDQVRAMH